MVFVPADPGIETIDGDVGVYQFVYQFTRGFELCLGLGADLHLRSVYRNLPYVADSQVVSRKNYFHQKYPLSPELFLDFIHEEYFDKGDNLYGEDEEHYETGCRCKRFDTVDALRAAADQLREGVSGRMLEKFIHLLYPQTETLLDYMNRPIVVLDEPEALYARMDSRTGEFGQAFGSALERGDALSAQADLMLTQEQVMDALRAHTLLAMTTILRPVERLRPTLLAQMGGMGAGSYGGQTREMCADITRWMRDG